MLMGTAATTEDAEARRRYLARQPRPRCSRASPISPSTGWSRRRASGRRLRAHRRSQAAGHPDRHRRRRRAGRGRARHSRAYERRPRRSGAALCHQAPGRARRRMALRRLRPRGPGAAARRPRCGCRSASASARRACCGRCSSRWRTRHAPRSRRAASRDLAALAGLNCPSVAIGPGPRLAGAGIALPARVRKAKSAIAADDFLVAHREASHAAIFDHATLAQSTCAHQGPS